jgi:general secretion pathway protein H
MARTRTSPTGETGDARGFTLMELLVVLAILGLTMVLAMPTLGRLLPGLELRTEARDVASALREARASAIGRNEEVTIVLDRERGLLQVAGKPIVQLSPKIGVSALETSHSSRAGDNEIRFFPDGTSTGGRLTLALGERQEHVVVDWLTGAVSIAE